MFKIHRRAVAAAAILAPLSLGLTAVASAPAMASPAAHVSVVSVRPDATPACSSNCFDLSSLALGRTEIQNAYVPGDLGVGGHVGQDVNINTGSNTHPNMDFTGAEVGTLGNFCPNDLLGGSGLSPTSYVCINYPAGFPVFESDWSPFGNQSGLCSGAAAPVFTGENVTLQECGTSPTTLWVGDLNDSSVHHGHVYLPWVSGGDTNFSHPLTLEVDPGTGHPVNQLKLATLNSLTGGTEPDTQAFTFVAGPVA